MARGRAPRTAAGDGHFPAAETALGAIGVRAVAHAPDAVLRLENVLLVVLAPLVEPAADVGPRGRVVEVDGAIVAADRHHDGAEARGDGDV